MLFLFYILADQGRRALEPEPAVTGVRMGHQSVSLLGINWSTHAMSCLCYRVTRDWKWAFNVFLVCSCTAKLSVITLNWNTWCGSFTSGFGRYYLAIVIAVVVRVKLSSFIPFAYGNESWQHFIFIFPNPHLKKKKRCLSAKLFITIAIQWSVCHSRLHWHCLFESTKINHLCLSCMTRMR